MGISIGTIYYVSCEACGECINFEGWSEPSVVEWLRAYKWSVQEDGHEHSVICLVCFERGVQHGPLVHGERDVN